jgi:hypothetical protein
MRTRFLLSALLVCLLAATPAPGASASAQWCETDPVVVITTPRGERVPVYVTNGAEGGPERMPAVLTAKMSSTAEPGHTWGGRGTHVHLYVVVQADGSDEPFATRTVASSGPYKSGVIYGQGTGLSGRAMEVMFNLPQS